MFKDMTVKTELILAFGIVALILAFVGGVGFYGANQSIADTKTIYEDRTVPAVDLATINDIWENVRKNLDVAVNSQDAAVARAKSHENSQLVKKAEGIWARYAQTNMTQDQEKLAKTKLELHAAYVDSGNRIFQMIIAGNHEAAGKAVREEAEPIFFRLHDTIFNMITLQGEVAGKIYAQAESNFQTISTIIFGAVVLGLLAAWALGFWLLGNIVTPLHRAIEIANAVSKGDLTTHITPRGTVNGFDRLINALKEMNDNLIDLVGTVIKDANQISTASSEIASGNLDLSQRTEEQASSLEETASSMEELTTTVKQNADNARQANQLASGASEIAVKGGDVVGQVVQTMSAINESSKKIVDIISVIDGIAFQTNILALNAAVEAARAGEQGRGFAVVATEVRTLAQRSAAAAKEIKELISDSVAKVEDGTRLVDEAGATMEEIVTSVKRVTDIMSEISAASHEQSSGIEQVNQAVTQMDEVTQQNAALVEQAAAASESMQEQAQELNRVVSSFRLPGSNGNSATTPVKRSNRPTKVANLPNRGPAAKKVAHAAPAAPTAEPKPRKVASGGGSDDNWEEF